MVRFLVRLLARFMVLLWTRPKVDGLALLPSRGPAIVVSNHLGDADLILGMAFSPINIDPVAKIELYEIPLLGRLMDAYGVIWVHRGQPDRRALHVIIQGLKEGRLIAIAPEGRESLTGSLEGGTGGAAYLALKMDVPLIPVTFTGTENKRIYTNLKHFRRTDITLTIGTAFNLKQMPDWREAVTEGTDLIMRKLAQQLPPAYRGIYE